MPASRRLRVVQPVMSSPPSATVPVAARPQPDDALDQLGLAVALDAGDADHLAAVDGEARRRRAPRGRRCVASAEALDARAPATVGHRRLAGLPATGSSLPTISSASWRAVTSSGSTVATVVPARITVIVVGDREHLVELVRDEDDREALGP